ncbi:MAG: RNA polymerase sigma factor [Pikeienuella sp.]
MEDEFEAELIASLPRLRRYALSLCRRADVADDLVQGAAERAIAARAGFDPGTSLQAWLFRILRNLWIDQTRRARTRGEELDVTETPEAAAHDGERTVEAVIALRETEAALNSLPAEQREVMRLVCLEELSYAEAAVVLDVPRGTVMSRLARGRVALAARLGIK